MLHTNTLYSQLIIVLIATVAAYYSGEDEDRAYCQLENGEIGTCMPISICYTAQQDFFNHKQATICRFEGLYPIVCCVLQNTTTHETYTYLPPATENPTASLSQRKPSISEESYYPGEYRQGSFCQLENGKVGTCTLISICYTAQQDLLRYKRPKICNFEGIQPIVCCEVENTASQEIDTYMPPSTENPTAALIQRKSSVSDEKCQNYINAKLETITTTTTTTTTTPLPPGQYTVAFAVGGINAWAKEFPHMAILGYGDGGEFEWQCGGSLISEDFVLTAAHCLFSQRLGDVKTVRVGDLDIAATYDLAQPQDFNVSATYAHPVYVSTSHYHDIALVKLDRPVIFTEYVKPACLETDSQIASDELLSATGWGATTFGGDLHTYLQKIDIFNLPLERCLPTYGPQRQLEKGIDGNIQICGGNLEKRVDTCQGDSGGPMQRLIPGSKKAYKIVGVTSFGKDCGLVPGVYVKVSAYLSWIESIVWPN